MYIKTKDELNNELLNRRVNREKITENIDVWAQEKYGIPDFHKITEYYFGKPNGSTLGILPRHIPTLKIEDVVSFIGARKLGLNPYGFSFEKDQFNVSNWSKNSCANMPVLKREGIQIKISHKRLPLMSGSRSVGNQLSQLNNISLDQLQLADSGSFLDFHKGLRKEVFNGSFPYFEVSRFLEQCFDISREQGKVNPDLTAYQNINGKQEKVKVGSVSSDAVLRPPMEWYYPLLFTQLLAGQWVMLETYRNAPEAEVEFKETIEALKTASGGFAPMIIETPLNVKAGNFTSKALLEYNLNINSKSALDELIDLTESIDNSNILQMFNEIAIKAITYKL